MMIRSRGFSAAFKAVLALSAWAGMALQFGVFSGQPDFSSIRYYTLLSNLLVALYFSVAAVFALRGRATPLPVFKGALIMGITVTGLVYHLMLSGGFTMGGTEALANQLLHTVTPIGAVLDWLLFDEKGRYDWRAPFRWVLLPDAYFVLVTLYGFLSGGRFHDGSRFPYFFIDFDQQGVGGVLLYVLALNVGFLALGYAFVAVDRWLSKKKAPAAVAEE